ncbi:hypothetical protein ACFFRR_010163 [Megaselia abdita]
MSGQQFCLRWNNHQPNFISVCSSLLHNGALVDVTLAAEGKQLQAHKIVLSACSSYFQSLFTANPCQHPIVILKDVQYNDLKTMVDFMYYGEVNVSQEQLPHILKTAEMLKIKGLAEMPPDAAAATLTKSDNKVEPSSEMHSSNSATTGGTGCNSATDSIWGQESQQFQINLQQHKRTPSPVGLNASPAGRRKRIRKTSNNGGGSIDKNSDEHSSLEQQMSMGQLGQMSFAGSSTNLAQNIHGKIIKDGSQDLESHHHLSHHQQHDSSQESIDESTHASHHLQHHIKPEADVVPQQIPLDIPDTPTPDEPPNVPQTAHSGYHLTPQSSTESLGMGTKRNRFLIRQQRIKRDSDTGTSHHSPDMEIDCSTSSLTTPQMLPTNLSGNISLHPIPSFSSNYLTVPTPKIERHSSEPAPNVPPSPPLQVSTTSAHLLNVPQGMSHQHHTPFLVKQHSHPLLPSQQSHLSPPGSAPINMGNQSSFELQRQYSQPVETSTPPSISISTTVSGGNTSNFTQFSGGLPGLIKTEHGSSSIVLLPESTGQLMTGSFEHTQSLRVKTEELQRSISTPNTSVRELGLSLENPGRSKHCPAIRPGPALGCNYCWNTVDGHNRILRRKTKYHCPECQTNLCIVPCFQEYHEKQSREASSTNSGAQSTSANQDASASSKNSSSRHFPKTESN